MSLVMLHNIHSQKLGARIAFDWNEMCCVTSEEEKIDKIKNLEKVDFVPFIFKGA